MLHLKKKKRGNWSENAAIGACKSYQNPLQLHTHIMYPHTLQSQAPRIFLDLFPALLANRLFILKESMSIIAGWAMQAESGCCSRSIRHCRKGSTARLPLQRQITSTAFINKYWLPSLITAFETSHFHCSTNLSCPQAPFTQLTFSFCWQFHVLKRGRNHFFMHRHFWISENS